MNPVFDVLEPPHDSSHEIFAGESRRIGQVAEKHGPRTYFKINPQGKEMRLNHFYRLDMEN